MQGAITPFTEVGSFFNFLYATHRLFPQFLQPILQLLFAALSDSDFQVKSNGAFASGMLVEHSDTDLSSQYMHLLAVLRPLFELPGEGPLAAQCNSRDNAAGAVARMICKNTGAVPLDQVRVDCRFHISVHH